MLIYFAECHKMKKKLYLCNESSDCNNLNN